MQLLPKLDLRKGFLGLPLGASSKPSKLLKKLTTLRRDYIKVWLGTAGDGDCAFPLRYQLIRLGQDN